MHLAIVTPVRLVGEGLAAALARVDDALSTETIGSLTILRARGAPAFAAAIVDVMQPIDLAEIRDFHITNPSLPLLALGLREHEAEVVAHGRAGFVGYICRDDGAEELCRKARDAVAGRLSCSPHITASIMRGLFRAGSADQVGLDLSMLTPREGSVARLVARGLSNKEIARHLQLSESTIKHHVHSILAKSGLSRRGQVMQQIRDDPWSMAEQEQSVA
jgi:two-component system nitrate/nitrite response regulator NarL